MPHGAVERLHRRPLYTVRRAARERIAGDGARGDATQPARRREGAQRSDRIGRLNDARVQRCGRRTTGVDKWRSTQDDKEMIYCPYTDCDISEDQASSEHIIPLSLGGIGGLEIDVDRDANSQLGNELDGALANDFFVSIRRTEHNARGHSRKDLWAISKKATYGDDERLAQVQLHRYHGLKVWDVTDGEYKNVFESVTFNTSVDLNLPIRFTEMDPGNWTVR